MGEQVLVDGGDAGAVQVFDREAAVGGEGHRDPSPDALPSEWGRRCREVAGEGRELEEEEPSDVRRGREAQAVGEHQVSPDQELCCEPWRLQVRG